MACLELVSPISVADASHLGLVLPLRSHLRVDASLPAPSSAHPGSFVSSRGLNRTGLAAPVSGCGRSSALSVPDFVLLGAPTPVRGPAWSASTLLALDMVALESMLLVRSLVKSESLALVLGSIRLEFLLSVAGVSDSDSSSLLQSFARMDFASLVFAFASLGPSLLVHRLVRADPSALVVFSGLVDFSSPTFGGDHLDAPLPLRSIGRLGPLTPACSFACMGPSLFALNLASLEASTFLHGPSCPDAAPSIASTCYLATSPSLRQPACPDLSVSMARLQLGLSVSTPSATLGSSLLVQSPARSGAPSSLPCASYLEPPPSPQALSRSDAPALVAGAMPPGCPPSVVEASAPDPPPSAHSLS